MNRELSTELLSAYLDGELTPNEQEAVELSLAENAQMRRLLDELRAIQGSLQSLPSSRAPADFRSRILDQIESDSRRQLLDSLAPPVAGGNSAASTSDAPPAAPPPVLPAANNHRASVAAIHSQRRQGDSRNQLLMVFGLASAAAVLLAVVLLVRSEKPDEVVLQPNPGAAPETSGPDQPAGAPANAPELTESSPSTEVTVERLTAPEAPTPEANSAAQPTTSTAASSNGSANSPNGDAPAEKIAARPEASGDADDSPPLEKPPAELGAKSALQGQAPGATIPAPRKGPFSMREIVPGRMIVMLDANGDGRVSDLEALYAVRTYQKLTGEEQLSDEEQQFVARLDKDKNNEIDEVEAQNGVAMARLSLNAGSRTVADLCGTLDADADGVLTLTEFEKLADRIGARGDSLRARLPLLFESVDRDGGGGISVVEAQLHADVFIEHSGLVVDSGADPSGLLPSEAVLLRVKRTMMALDRGRDRRISRREARDDENLRMVFDDVDLNQDDLVSEGEMYDFLKMKLPAVDTPVSFSFRWSGIR